MAAATAFTGCSHKDENKETTTESTVESSSESEDVVAFGNGTDKQKEGTGSGETSESADEKTAVDGTPIIESTKTSDCIELKNFSDLKISYSYSNGFRKNEAEIYARLEKEAHSLANDPDATVQWGDKVDINIESVIDGKKTEDFTYTDYLDPVGSHTLDDKIDEVMIGKKAGDILAVEISYDKDYPYEAFAGKMVTYKIKINQIARPDDPTEEELKMANSIIEPIAADDKMEVLYVAAKQAIMDTATYKAYPRSYIQNERKRFEQRYINNYKSIDNYLELFEMTEEEFEEIKEATVVYEVRERLVLQALKEATGIDENNKTYRERVGETTTDTKEDEVLYRLILDEVLKKTTVTKE